MHASAAAAASHVVFVNVHWRVNDNHPPENYGNLLFSTRGASALAFGDVHNMPRPLRYAVACSITMTTMCILFEMIVFFWMNILGESGFENIRNIFKLLNNNIRFLCFFFICYSEVFLVW